MSEIKVEYPEGQRSAEMILVRMLKEHRCWNDYMDITQAIWRIRFTADRMKEERSIMQGNSTDKEQP